MLDASRSMMRSDFRPRRFVIALETAKSFSEKKFSSDLKDRISILLFGKQIKRICGFTNQYDKLRKSLKASSLSISGKGDLNEALSFALQLLVEEMRKIGGKISRILIISDGLQNFSNSERFEDTLNTALGLGVIIDSFQLGLTQDFSNNILKRISRLTRGEFGFFRNPKAAINAGRAFASKKELVDTPDYLSSGQKEKSAPLLNAIALPLKRLSVLEIRYMMNNNDKSKTTCQICHSRKAPLTDADFFSEGRFCPSCGRAMHLSCAALWAKKTEYKKNIFRCPFCYFLLKISHSVMKLIEDYERKDQKIHIINDMEKNAAKMKPISSEKIDEINESCSYCHNIFLGKYEVYQCSNCGAYYHKPCLEKMFNELQACRYCGYSFKI
ncbi:MAG: von Willebrand factor type A domain protein [Promethearchaeota archaeon]|nr:MAG: von Willebrand factor type A domain protein [Candidatus Lokiarchaeota archaeon]